MLALTCRGGAFFAGGGGRPANEVDAGAVEENEVSMSTTDTVVPGPTT
jgi:hypothetical protein